MPTINQTVTIRCGHTHRQSIEGGTVVAVSPTGKRVDVACDSGIVAFYKSPKNNMYYKVKDITTRLVF